MLSVPPQGWVVYSLSGVTEKSESDSRLRLRLPKKPEGTAGGSTGETRRDERRACCLFTSFVVENGHDDNVYGHNQQVADVCTYMHTCMVTW